MSTIPTSTGCRRRSGRNHPTGHNIRHSLTAASNVPAVGGGFRSGACSFFARGHCRYGDQCKLRHDSPATTATISLSPSTSVATNHPEIEIQSLEPLTQTLNDSRARPRNKPCFAWKRGSCARGDQCQYAHDPREGRRPNLVSHFAADISPVARSDVSKCNVVAQQRAEESYASEKKRKLEQDKQRKSELARLRKLTAEKKKEADLEANRRAENLALEQLKRRQQIIEKHLSDALVTIQRIPLGSTIVTFGAGVQIVCTVPGFETCRVTVRGIPSGVQIHQFREFLQTSLGEMGESAKQNLYVVSLKRWNQSQEGVVLTDAKLAKDMVRRLNGVIFKGQSLKLDLSERGEVGGMHARDWGALSLKISWREPSSRYVVTYSSPLTAEEQIQRFDGTLAFGRKIKVELNANRNGYTNLSQILISDLPVQLTDDIVRNFFGGMTVRKISGQACAYTESDVERTLKEHIQWLCVAKSITPPEFGESRRQTHTAGVAVENTVYARFDKWDSAREIHDNLKGKRFSWIGNAFLRLWLPDPIQYEITISLTQYRAQLSRWKSLLSVTGDEKDLRMRITEKADHDKVFIRIEGNDAKAVGMLKVRVENLAAGEKLSLWHRSFETDSGRSFLRALLELTEALVVPDRRMKIIKAYGEPASIEKVREAISQEINRLAGLEYTVTLHRNSVRFFAQQGIAHLKERFGEDSVSLNISASPRVTIRGGEDAQHALHTVLEQSRKEFLPAGTEGGSRSSCPICLDEVSMPVQLGCGHEYCTACLHHFFTADIKSFPLVCLGDEVQCGKPIALPIIQKFLTEVQFNALLETAFLQHVEQNPEVLRYCPTPDCEQLYRCADSGGSHGDLSVFCPSCLSELCTRCHEGHRGMTCDERQRAQHDQENNEELNAKWAEMTGVKRCPRCNVWIEKTEGCNHISCRCGAHICWRCLGIFESETIYEHMSTAHGGFGLGDGIIRNVDYDAQARELHFWNNLAPNRRIAQEPPRLFHPPPNDRLLELAQEEQRRVNYQIELRRQQQERRIRDLEATQRRTRQEEGGNWCTIM